MTDSALVYSYQFNLPEKEPIRLNIEIDSSTITLEPNDNTSIFWTELGFNQCANCPLNIAEHPVCPVAQNLIPLLDISNALVSYQEVSVIITSDNRCTSATTTMQRAMSSALGLVMATSPCPHLEFLKPMARFHLPLASEEETVYRTTSMYMLAQYFRNQQGMSYELGFEGLTQKYANLKTVNRALANRIRAAIKQDATVNAIILLDLLSQAVTYSIEDQLDELQPLFKSLLMD